MTQTYQEISIHCCYGHWGYEGRSSNNHGFEWTCRNKNNIPKGHSWGVCSERECPLLPRNVTNLRIYNSDGKVVATADNAVYFKKYMKSDFHAVKEEYTYDFTREI